ncbi:MAG: autoinducer 2 ABC transporter substrate-binding protein [Spirochaetaceae bacterium]|jgi:simple sugar transport system substrate-binding protein/rhamnose transport system substrate-binding protein|nr:autoinducer 2 ABC transporter substrate-binding protein [Spirochaetaceae bacterium]
MKKTVVLALAVLLCAGAGWAKGGAAKSGAKVPTVVVMPKLVGIPYFNASQAGAEQAGKDLGINVIYTGPTTADAAEQVKMLEDLIVKGVDAICVAPNDAAALTPVLQRAKKAGIKILDWDTSADQSVVDLSVHQIDDKQYGEHIWDLLVQQMGDTGDYAILTGGLSASNLNTWIDHGLAYAKGKYPALNLVTEKIPTDEKQQAAYQKTLELITAYPDLKGIIGVSTPTPIGAAQAVQEKGLKDTIAVVGTALPTDSGPYLEDGSLRVATLWDPAKLGYLTVVLANNLLKGQTPADGQDVPNVGKITVNGKIIIMGPPTDFTSANYKNFSF